VAGATPQHLQLISEPRHFAVEPGNFGSRRATRFFRPKMLTFGTLLSPYVRRISASLKEVGSKNRSFLDLRKALVKRASVSRGFAARELFAAGTVKRNLDRGIPEVVAQFPAKCYELLRP
jgi:hypothetical protein